MFCLPALLPAWLRCLICEESLDIFLCPQKALHLLSGLAVFRVGCFLLPEQFSVLGIQLLHLGQLLDTLLIKKFFGCLVQQNLRLMLSAEFLAVPRLAVSDVYLVGLGVMEFITCTQRTGSLDFSSSVMPSS